jgi:hypothetical protein
MSDETPKPKHKKRVDLYDLLNSKFQAKQERFEKELELRKGQLEVEELKAKNQERQLDMMIKLLEDRDKQ